MQGPRAEAPPAARRAWTLQEFSGGLGDLGTFLPHVVGAIAVVGLSPTGVLTGFGLLYIAAGAFFGVPMGVQPMKAASAAVLVVPMRPGEIVGAGLVIGLFFLLVGLSGLAGRLSRLIPRSVTAGIQLGLGLSLAALGVRLIGEQAWLGVLVAAIMAVLLNNRRLPAALVGLILGVGISRLLPDAPLLPAVQLGLHLPPLVWPSWNEVLRGTELAVLPQIPLTLTNAIVVTAAVTRELFPDAGQRVTERNLAVSTGLGNLLAAPLGGYLMCHGAGGITAHRRFGARTGDAPIMVGLLLLLFGLLLGEQATAVMALVPQAVLGGLLFFSGLELASSAKPQEQAGGDLLVVLVIAAIAVAANAALAFVVGLVLAAALKHRLVKL